ncbi:5-methylcytosine-specific restriction endonuclease McrA [Haloactinopolyspora alba]|uniref:5-methylcytosine-specific restriction endonuclease McrA n=1 Tax=Haloactinopolyspora alba TaxID=648780 RepID=A0A2P8DXJ3_9ACTN|nr:HNH endonuclease [Haloactinopolyspora alba]PSL01887.1 5-methylcytosine-specific restriction endonuclease McrA [Haloactinopolyspora alba]
MNTLVLNASYEPLAVVPVRRAVILVLTEKAVMEHADSGKLIRSATRELPTPLVVRLLRFVRVPYRRKVPWSRSGVLDRDGRRCAYCGGRASSIDHLVPTSRGGASRSWRNTVASCVACNQAKADRTPAEAGMRLLVQPYEPKAHRALVLALGVPTSEALPDWLAAAVT